jgi:hypothetical protein
MFNLKCCDDDSYDERMMMNECNVFVERLKLREPSLGFLNWGFDHEKSMWFGRLM